MVKNWEEKSDVKEIAKALAFAQTGKILIILKHFDFASHNIYIGEFEYMNIQFIVLLLCLFVVRSWKRETQIGPKPLSY